MSLSRDLQRKVTLAIYDHKCMARKASHMLKCLKEVEQTLDGLGKSKGCRK